MPASKYLGCVLAFIPALTTLVLEISAAPVVAPSVDRTTTSRGAKLILAGGACLQLGEMEQPAYTCDTFVQRINDLLVAQRAYSARRLIQRYPDVAQDVLRSATNDQAGNATLQLIAQVHDEQCAATPGSVGWFALLRDRAEHPQKYAAYETFRRQLLDLLRAGRSHEAMGIPITKKVPAPFLEIDAFELLGEACLLGEKPDDAVKALSAALTRAHLCDVYQAVQISLLLAEAQRRADKKAEGVGTWEQTAQSASQLLVRPVPIVDPIFWERASYLRPVQCVWPAQAIGNFAPAGTQMGHAQPGQHSAEESWLWAKIGQWRLDRNELQSALVSLKRAESFTMDRQFQEQLQLLQAQTLIRFGQSAAAISVLVKLASDPTRPSAAPALALLGGAKLKDGSTRQALSLLTKAVEGSPGDQWPGRAQAEADLGLAYIMTGDAVNGLRWLHSAQQRFANSNEHEMLMQSLDNEAKYWEHINKPEQASLIRQRMRAVEAGAPGT